MRRGVAEEKSARIHGPQPETNLALVNQIADIQLVIGRRRSDADIVGIGVVDIPVAIGGGPLGQRVLGLTKAYGQSDESADKIRDGGWMRSSQFHNSLLD